MSKITISNFHRYLALGRYTGGSAVVEMKDANLMYMDVRPFAAITKLDETITGYFVFTPNGTLLDIDSDNDQFVFNDSGILFIRDGLLYSIDQTGLNDRQVLVEPPTITPTGVQVDTGKCNKPLSSYVVTALYEHCGQMWESAPSWPPYDTAGVITSVSFNPRTTIPAQGYNVYQSVSSYGAGTTAHIEWVLAGTIDGGGAFIPYSSPTAIPLLTYNPTHLPIRDSLISICGSNAIICAASEHKIFIFNGCKATTILEQIVYIDDVSIIKIEFFGGVLAIFHSQGVKYMSIDRNLKPSPPIDFKEKIPVLNNKSIGVLNNAPLSVTHHGLFSIGQNQSLNTTRQIRSFGLFDMDLVKETCKITVCNDIVLYWSGKHWYLIYSNLDDRRVWMLVSLPIDNPKQLLVYDQLFWISDHNGNLYNWDPFSKVCNSDDLFQNELRRCDDFCEQISWSMKINLNNHMNNTFKAMRIEYDEESGSTLNYKFGESEFKRYIDSTDDEMISTMVTNLEYRPSYGRTNYVLELTGDVTMSRVVVASSRDECMTYTGTEG